MREALTAGTSATALWRGMRNEAGDFFDMEIVDCDEGMARWLNRPREAIVGQRYTRIIPTGVEDRLPVYLETLNSGTTSHIVFHGVERNGEIKDAEVRVVPCGDDMAFAQLLDVTDRETSLRDADRLRVEAQMALDQLEAALNVSPDGFAIYLAERDDHDRVCQIRLAYANEAATLPTGRGPESWRGVTLDEWFPEARETGLWDRIVQVLDGHEPQRFVSETTSVHGWSGLFESIVTPFGIDMALVTWHEVAVEAATSGPQGLAPAPPVRLDDLTGLPVRGEFLRQVRAGGAGLLGVMDIDDFRRLNALVGHRGGDRILAGIAQGVRSIVPAGSIVGRTGPDEFGIFVPTTDGDLAQRAIEESLDRMLGRIAASVKVPRIRVSGGWARVGAPGEVDTAMVNAELALRAASDAGGGRFTAYDSQVRGSMLVRALEAADLIAGLERGDFALAYQPIVNLRDRSPRGAECLVRWRHPTLGELSPAMFIPVAERSGSIMSLGAWIIDSAVEHLSANPGLLRAAINVSGVQLMADDVPDCLARALERNQVDASRVVIEVTESELLPSSRRIDEQLEAIRAMGARIALDDFGSGYSSLAYLDRLPIDIVKLDAQFLAGEPTPRRERLLTAVTAIIESIGATSLIEGVETEEQWRLALGAGVTLGQGYLFGHPVVP